MPALNKEFAQPSWGDDVDDYDQDEITETQDEDGIHTTEEIKTNDDGKQVKVTRKIKKKLIKEAVQHAVAERKKLKKFGDSKNDPSGPQTDTTNISEEIFLKLSSNNKSGFEIEEVKKEKAGPQAILCRICKGEHWTHKCPYKNTPELIPSLSKGAESRESLASSTNEVEADSGKSGKYIPPSLRNRSASGQDVRGERPQYDDRNTIRITNISEDTTDRDLNELVRRFGPTQRVFFKREKGFAFVTFLEREDAEKAIATLNGYGYDSLILHVEWSIRQNRN